MKLNKKISNKSSMDKVTFNPPKTKQPAPKKAIIPLENILANFPEYLYWTNAKGVFLGCNQELAHYLGFKSSNEIIGKTIEDIGKALGWKNSIIKSMRQSNETVIKTGMKKTIEEVATSASGEKVVFFSHKSPLRNAKGKIIGLIGTSVNINTIKKGFNKLTAAKEKAEQLSKDSFSNLEQIIACMPGSVFWKDKKGIYQGCNDTLAKLFGVSKAEVIGKTDHYFSKKLRWPREVAKSFIKVDQNVMRSGVPRLNIEEPPFKFIDGKAIYQLDNKVPLRNEAGDIIGIVGVGLDITELKNTQKLLKEEKVRVDKLSKTKSEFIANMSHDVKTPLSGIIGLAEILKEQLTGEQLDFVHDIADSAHQLMSFFNNCLEIAKSEQINIALIKERFSLKALIGQIAKLFHSAIANKQLDFSIDYDLKIPSVLYGSRAAIYRILLNLTGNAIKFTHQGSVTIYASLTKMPNEKGVAIKLTIQDTGIGIPKSQQKIIFEQFTRLTPSYQGIYEGSGIGLFVVNKLAKSIGGQIHINSKKGQGSKFTIIFPLDLPLIAELEYENDKANLEPQLTNIAQMPSHQHKVFDQAKITSKKILPNILFVEDSPVAQQIAMYLLSPLGCTVEIVNCGKKALEVFQPGKYQLILMDIELPDLEGYLIAKQLRNIEKSCSSYQVPIIGLSAHALKTIKKHCQQAHMQAILHKPLSAEQVRQIFDRYIYNQPTVEVSGLEILNDGTKIKND